MTPRDDCYLMSLALMLARRVLGSVAPNPAVGCVIAKKQDAHVRILARAATGEGGRPHAETQALERAGIEAKGSSVYVTLEPCAHQGETPPCVEALVQAGVARVVYAMGDPDARVNGRGAKRLQEAGIMVEAGVLRDEAESINAGYLLHRTQARPLVTLKLATSLDGRIATASGASRWITGEQARRRGHLLRATSDAILVGSGCALKDDPMLTCRLEGMESRSPIRIIADGRLRLSPRSRLAKSAKDFGLWILTRPDAPAKQRKALQACGATLLDVAGEPLNMKTALEILAKRGITRLLVEGGAMLATSLLQESLVDRIEWFRAPLLLGDDSLAAFGDLGLEEVSSAPRLHPLAQSRPGEDIQDSFLIKRES